MKNKVFKHWPFCKRGVSTVLYSCKVGKKPYSCAQIKTMKEVRNLENEGTLFMEGKKIIEGRGNDLCAFEI